MFFSATIPADEAVLITLPLPERTRCGIANREQRNAPVRFTARVRCQCSIGALSTVPGSSTPALLCTIWSEPNAATVRSISHSTPSGEATSTPTAIARPPAARIRWATSSAASSRTSATATEAPSRANRVAVAAPIPEPAPVITADRPSRRPTHPPFRPTSSGTDVVVSHGGSRWEGGGTVARHSAAGIRWDEEDRVHQPVRNEPVRRDHRRDPHPLRLAHDRGGRHPHRGRPGQHRLLLAQAPDRGGSLRPRDAPRGGGLRRGRRGLLLRSGRPRGPRARGHPGRGAARGRDEHGQLFRP